MQRKSFSISGRVQGVGFRPFVFRLAERFSLTGTVQNGPQGVGIEAQGDAAALCAFADALRSELPPLALIASLSESDLEPVPGEAEFRIVASGAGLAHDVLISPDVATCDDCLADMREPGGRRWRYPFTNCTNCGPRYSITRAMPYDRAQTSMSCFPLCPECRAEYENPRDRRFHAQPNACPVCGPRVWVPGGPDGAAAISEVAGRLRAGAIAAVKGLGGFHLVCDATNDATVERLRKAKERPHKPLAVMVAHLDAARDFVRVGADEERLLCSLERPIVLCPARAGGSALSALISPDTSFIGVMLPYTPLHHLLLEETGVPLVMTSGNRGGEPICLGNREALTRLGGIAEVFLLHNRDILIRTDDSVLRPMPGELLESGDAAVLHLRRARGFVPAPLALPARLKGREPVLALGAELKNTVCFSRGGEAFVSQHIGDLQNLETTAFQGEIARHLASVLQVKPALLALDSHPDFVNQSSDLYPALPRKSLQHHFAHAQAVLAENDALCGAAPALVLALDGTGYAPPELDAPESGGSGSGRSGSIWGGELILMQQIACGGGYEAGHGSDHGPDPSAGCGKAPSIAPEARRVGSLSLLPLPGGEAAIRQPWRIAHGFLHQLGLLEGARNLPWLPEHYKAASLIPQMIDRGLNSPPSSSAGRLFDAVAALLGLCLETTYEGQAAIRLEEAQFSGGTPPVGAGWRELYAGTEILPCPLALRPRSGLDMELDSAGLFRAVFERAQAGESVAALARAFHRSLAEGLADMVLAASRAYGLTPEGFVGLSGGVMQNMSLLILLKDALRARGLTPLTHHRLPPNDGCISFGQSVWALGCF